MSSGSFLNDGSCLKVNECTSHGVSFITGARPVLRMLAALALLHTDHNVQWYVRHICQNPVRSYITGEIYLLDVSSSLFLLFYCGLQFHLDLMHYRVRRGLGLGVGSAVLGCGASFLTFQ